MTPLNTVGECLQFLRQCSDEEYIKYCHDGLSKNQLSSVHSEDFYSGKVREMIVFDKHCYMHHTDRLSAFDKFISLVPLKGILLNAISAYWLEQIKDIVPSHFIGPVDERTLNVRRVQPIKVEVVVRNYMAGSFQKKYLEGARNICGLTIPDGLGLYEKFKTPIITPTTKAAVFEHDEDIAPEQIIASGLCTFDEWQTISSMALELFAAGQKKYADLGWLLVDTKYEFGKDSEGKVYLIDELHTPDSSRLWVKGKQNSYLIKQGSVNEPEMFDKQIIRDFLVSKGFQGEGLIPNVPREVILQLLERYNEIAETITGQPIKTAGIYAGLAIIPC